jgi:hypothetical protein
VQQKLAHLLKLPALTEDPTRSGFRLIIFRSKELRDEVNDYVKNENWEICEEYTRAPMPFENEADGIRGFQF